ncbi:hypothetical protein G7Y89_g9753 [Cudoniella acicularis]|uniref:Transcription factor domain-containing protein n=1 Tax=Cudoniella acicularis TaxID=354080 RepID=A0A8H4VZT9_9HELO|nr:hypothetical protein G7Y89_g9753 [Cudoniella acicularis]
MWLESKPTAMMWRRNVTREYPETLHSLEYAFFDGQSTVRAPNKNPSKSLATAASPKLKDALVPLQWQWRNTGPETCSNAPLQSALNGALAVPQYKLYFIVMLQETFCPNLPASNKIIEGTCSSWIATAYEILASKDSDMLSESLLAMSLTVLGREQRDQDFATASLRHYSKALRRLQVELGKGNRGQSEKELNLITCLACASYEMIANQSVNSFTQHLRGFGALLQGIGVHSLSSIAGRRVFYEYRAMDITISLSARRATFLSSPNWLNPPWDPLEVHQSNPLQTLIDRCIGVPALMEKWDIAVQNNMLNPNTLNDFIQEALEFQTTINDWEIRLRGDEKTQLYIGQISQPNNSPNYENSANFFPISYRFPTFDIAGALMYYDTVQILLYELLVEMGFACRRLKASSPDSFLGVEVEEINTPDLIEKSAECADRICQSVDYFFDKDKRMIGRIVILLPFETARGFYGRLCGSWGNIDVGGVRDERLEKRFFTTISTSS